MCGFKQKEQLDLLKAYRRKLREDKPDKRSKDKDAGDEKDKKLLAPPKPGRNEQRQDKAAA